MQQTALPSPGPDRDAFLQDIGAWVTRAIAEAFPPDCDGARLAALTSARPCGDRPWSEQELGAIRKAVVAPMWELVRRGGKCWRPFLASLACEAVGGDARRMWPHVIAALELMQVGSLMIDDVEDGSHARRNGPAVHLLHGAATTINAGTLSYLQWNEALASLELPEAATLEIYACLLDTLCAAHVGQGLDIVTVADGLDEAARTGEAGPLVERIRTIHHLKTARFIGFLGRIGAVIGGAPPERKAALEAYGVALGQAFQIRDDVLNLRGFENDLRPRGEDLAHGKATLPVALALGRLGADARHGLVALLRDRSASPEAIRRALALIEECGALDACDRMAHELFERSWARLDAVLDDSSAKLLLHQLGEAMVLLRS